MATLAELQTQLASVRGAIARIEATGQRVGIGGEWERQQADLNSLYARERDLEQRIVTKKRGGLRFRQIIPGR